MYGDTVTIAKKKHPYYDYRRLFSFNAFIMVLCGGRGLGKTYGAKKKGIQDAIKKGEQFIYLRRYLEELKAAKLTFFADIAGAFPDYDCRVNGPVGQISPALVRGEGETDSEWNKRVKGRKWTTVCYFVALSVTQSQKSTSFPLVTLIIFDEFIIERSSNSSYLRKEVEALMNFYNTVDRGQDKTRLLLLANSVSIMNPYFSEWDIQPDQLPEISKHADGDIVCHFPDSKDYQKSIYQTRFGKFISKNMRDYADYAVGNEFKDANDKLISEKTANAKYKYSVETEGGTFSVWYDMGTSTFYILSRRPGNERILTLVPENMDKGKIRVTLNEPLIKSLRSAFNRGKVEFDKPSTRNAFVPIFDRK